jgi:hypothetical protein
LLSHHKKTKILGVIIMTSVMYPTGSSPVLTRVFRSIGVKSSTEGNFESIYNSLVNHYNYGVNQEHAFDGPGSWASFEKKLFSAGVMPTL